MFLLPRRTRLVGPVDAPSNSTHTHNTYYIHNIAYPAVANSRKNQHPEKPPRTQNTTNKPNPRLHHNRNRELAVACRPNQAPPLRADDNNNDGTGRKTYKFDDNPSYEPAHSRRHCFARNQQAYVHLSLSRALVHHHRLILSLTLSVCVDFSSMLCICIVAGFSIHIRRIHMNIAWRRSGAWPEKYVCGHRGETFSMGHTSHARIC